MAEVKFSSLAYCKMILHSAKYPHCAINGVLLSDSSKCEDLKKNSSVEFIDAVPLFHLCLNLAPMAEIALTQIDHWANAEGLVVSGYYVANENIRDTSIDKPGNRIADKIAEHFSSACLVLIDNKQLSLTMEEPALLVNRYAENKWKPLDSSSWSLSDKCLDAAAGLLERGHQKDIVDFDNHLDNVALDWRNKPLEAVLSQY